MSNLPITHPYNSFGASVDKHIGDAFPAVEAVAKRLQEIVYLANHLTDIQPRDIELQAEPEQQEVLWRRAGETEWKLLITFGNLLGSDLGDMNTTVSDAIERIEELERTQSDFWQKTPDPYESEVVVTSPYYTVVHDGKYYSPNVNALPFFTGEWDEGQWRDLAALPGTPPPPATVEFPELETIDDLAIFEQGGKRYAMFEVDETGKPLGTRPQVQNTLANLMTMEGKSGLVSVPSDAYGLVIHLAPNSAYHLQQVNNPSALGSKSWAVGENANTLSSAHDAFAVGPNAVGYLPGMHSQGSLTPGVQRSLIMVGATSVGDGSTPLTLDSGVIGSGNATIMNLPGLYEVSIVVMAKDADTNNWARFKRNCIMKVAGTTVNLSNETTPEADVRNGLAPTVGINLYGLPGNIFSIYVNGEAGRTLKWAGFITLNQILNT
jgi:hypothetical protein